MKKRKQTKIQRIRKLKKRSERILIAFEYLKKLFADSGQKVSDEIIAYMQKVERRFDSYEN